MKNIIQFLVIQSYKISIGLALTAIWWYGIAQLFDGTTLNSWLAVPLYVFILVIVFILLDSLIVGVINALVIYLGLIVLMVVKYYPELLLLQSKQLLFSLAVDPVVLILVSFIISTALVWGIHTIAKLEFADLILNRLVKVNILNYLLVPVSVFVIWVSFISPFWAWKQAEVSPVKLYKIFTDQPIVDKQAHQRIAISPEQTIEVHMKALKEEDYRTAFMATSGSVNADDMDYWEFLNQAKEELIQLGEPISHRVKAVNKSGQRAEFILTIVREDKSEQDYDLNISQQNGQWLIDNIILTNMRN